MKKANKIFIILAVAVLLILAFWFMNQGPQPAPSSEQKTITQEEKPLELPSSNTPGETPDIG